MLRSQLGNFLTLILFKQVLSVRIILGQENKLLGINLSGMITIFCSVHLK